MNNIKAVNPDNMGDSMVSDWSATHKKHHKSKMTPMTRNTYFGPTFFGNGGSDPDNDGDNDVPGVGGDTDNDII